ncbi:MAG: serine hydrolase domain-containing protein [Caldilineaceae bacterium]
MHEFFTDFGEAFNYSNQMVATGGYVAAAAAGGEWATFPTPTLRSWPSGSPAPSAWENTTLSFDEVMARDNYAVPHGLSLAAEYYPLEMAVEKLLLPVAPAGAHWSTAEDMAAYLITQMNAGVAPNGERIVSAEPLRNTWQPQVQMTANSSYGLGWIVGEYKGVRMLRHNGNTFGFTSELAFLPDAGVGIVVLTNARATNIFNEAVLPPAGDGLRSALRNRGAGAVQLGADTETGSGSGCNAGGGGGTRHGGTLPGGLAQRRPGSRHPVPGR